LFAAEDHATLVAGEPAGREFLAAVNARHLGPRNDNSELAARIAGATAATEGDVTPLLEEGIAAGRLFRYPPKTKAGKPRYWDRDLIAIVRAGLADALQAADAPLTALELAARIPGATSATEGDVAPLLEEGVAAGRLFRFPPKSKTGKPRYWDRDQIAASRAEILKFLEAKGPQKLAPLRKVAGSLDTAQFDTLLGELRTAGQLFSHPPLGKAKEPLFAIRPVSPQPYLQEVEKSLTLVVEKLQQAQVSDEDLRRAIVQMVESAGVRFGGVPGTRAETPVTTPAATFDLIALMKRIEPGAERGALVGAGELRRVAGVSKEEFDETALALSRAGRLSLHRHNFVGNLSTEERDLLVTDGAGNYFVGMALRQNNG
ncbi:MAG: hypothetical protein NT069_21180, partial [Planctomycetota bacterium]|nr:hypothetical protein [Planctomycetota bacterium]